MNRYLLSILAVLLLAAVPAEARKKQPQKAPAEVEAEAPAIDPSLYQGMKWRLVGPFRGGRSNTATGVIGDPLTYYFGATGGGVWKTTDAGNTWKNVSDGFIKTGSVGAVAVAPSDPNVVYVGMGEGQIRGVASSHGDGVYRSTDAGATWTHLGLEKTRQISTIRIHPDNPDVVYVAAQGSPWTPNPERGVYRSTDGGANWEKVLFLDETTGVSDLSMDVTNPRILYAALWDHQRMPWQVRSGGPGSGIHKSTDGGDTWNKLAGGLPAAMGKIGVAVSPAKPDRVWAIVEAENGGLFRSDNGGKSWRNVNSERVIQTRSWYYMKVFADPNDAETVWVMNAPALRSIDGGRTFTPVRTPHGDNHDLWIDPHDSNRMINANDGGANVTWNGGQSWSTQANQPTAQFYRVITDNKIPYRIYGGQQDNSTVGIRSRGLGGGIDRTDWMPVGGCESAHIAFDPDNPRYVYAGCYQGIIGEFDVEARSARDIMAYPFMGLGNNPVDQKYRFNWNAPILTSPHDRSVIYHAANVLLRTRDRGHSWEAISPDLTRNEEDKQGFGGAPITNEAAGGEIYNTIMYVVESPHEQGTLWVGSDDGLVHLTRDDGANWENVTPPDLPESQINAIEVSPHDPATAWIAVTRYKFGDFTPHIFKTADYGATWERRVEGIGEEAWVRVVREDPEMAGLLYAGTETGIYLSMNDGQEWQPFQLNLPIVPITDLTIRHNDLVAATQGRAFWVLDDLTPLHQLKTDAEGARLYKPRDTLRVGGGFGRPAPNRGQNPPGGVQIYYTLTEDVVASLQPTPKKDDEDGTEEDGAEEDGDSDAGDGDEDGAAEADEDGEDDADENADDGEDEDAEEDDEPKLKLEIINADGDVVRTYPDPKADEAGGPAFGPPRGPNPAKALPAKAGLNRVAWNLMGEPMTRVPKLFSFVGFPSRPAPPGTYTVRLTVLDEVTTQSFELLPDPNGPIHSAEAYAEQSRVIDEMFGVADEMHASIKRLREVRDQVQAQIKRLEDHDEYEPITEAGEDLAEAIDEWEEKVIQPKTTNVQDVINHPNPLGGQLLWVYVNAANSEPPVTAGAQQRFADLRVEWEERKGEMQSLIDEDLAAFNALFTEHEVPAVLLPVED